MLVKFTTNVGSNDSDPLGLDCKKCTLGAQLEVQDDVGERLIRRNFAVQAEIKGTAKKPVIADAKPAEEMAKQTKSADKPEFKTSTKES